MKPIFTLIVLTMLAGQAVWAQAPELKSLAPAHKAQDLYEGFREPPQDAKIRVWWHWMDGNISKEGIKADLEWMKRTGIGGIQQFDAGGAMFGGGETVTKKLPYMSQEWKDAFRYAIAYADSIGMETAIASAPGWSSTGGPWVKPENAMKKLVWRTVEVNADSPGKGRKAVERSIALPEPYRTVGKFQNYGEVVGITGASAEGIEQWYQDVAVVAVRLSENDLTPAQLGASVSASGGRFTLEALTDGDLSSGEVLPAPEKGSLAWIQYSFPEPQTIRSMTLAGGDIRSQWGCPPHTYRFRLQKSADGETWTDVCRIPSGTTVQQTITIPTTTARHFRLACSVPPAGKIYEFVLHPVVRVNHAEEKAGFAAPHDLADYPTPGTADAAGETVVLTDRMDADGNLHWTVPPGRWRIYRFGASLTGKRNHPAPPEATGLEVDKLDEAAWMDYFRNYMDMYKEASGGRVGAHGIQYLLTDSYEAEQMTWTRTLPEAFRDGCGYDLIPWLPVLTGQVVGSAEESERFLFDWRETLGGLFAANYDRINDIVREYGMKGRYTESHENGRVYVGDGMDLKRTATVPMSAFWMPDGGDGSALMMAMADIKESSSTAHVFGQNIAAAESFTVAGMKNNAYSYYPGNLKGMADLAMYHGLNRFVIHECSHQPSDAHKPGLGLLIFGQWFGRHETWAEYARYWADYLARSSYMLQQGHYVADVLWYYGEDNNICGLYAYEHPDVPDGYAYDFINPYGLLHVLHAEDKVLRTDAGMRYKVLALGENCEVMSLEILRKLDELVRAGIFLCGKAPSRPAGRLDDPAEFDRLVADIWQTGRPNVRTGRLENVLSDCGITPDFRHACSDRLYYVHRRTDRGEIYWVCNPGESCIDTRVTLRDGRKPWQEWAVLNPETGRFIEHLDEDFRLVLQPGQALFLVENLSVPAGAETEPALIKELPGTLEMTGDWTVSFDGPGAPEGSVTMASLASLSTSEDPAVKYFSGTATYTRQFTVGKKQKNLKGCTIDLGDVFWMADVYVDGRHAGFLWKKPYVIQLDGPLAPGTHTLEVRVVNLWPNRIIGDAQPGAARHTFTPFSFYGADAPLQPSGLVGPVKIGCF